MRTIFLLLLFISQSIYSQIKSDQPLTVTYRMTYVSDSTLADHKISEDFELLINQKSSFYSSRIFLLQDSILNEAKVSGLLQLNLSNMPHTRFKYIIAKSDGKITFYDNILKYKFSYPENLKFNWTLLPGTKDIGGYQCNKARMNYGGRTWNAWYAPSIPIPNGPYKFGQLPGLILEIEDARNHYQFHLVSIKKTADLQNSILQPSYFNKFKTLSKQQYLKAKFNVYDNIVEELKRSGTTLIGGEDRVRANLKSRNNPIELK